jgi:FAD/FMN-containing dehydrogenase
MDGHRVWNWPILIVGSEGTLACLLEATVRLTPLPKATALAIVHFDNEIDSLRHVPAILRMSRAPSNCWTRWCCASRCSMPRRAPWPRSSRGSPEAVLLVEVFGEDQDDANRRIAALVADLRRSGSAMRGRCVRMPKAKPTCGTSANWAWD